MPIPNLPYETIIQIIEELSLDKSKAAITGLKACANASHALLPVCQNHLFAKVVLRDDTVIPGPNWSGVKPSLEVPRVREFGDIVTQRPAIAKHIRTLIIHIPHFYADASGPTSYDDFQSIMSYEVMHVIDNLQVLELRGCSTDWKDVASKFGQITQLLTYLFSLPSLNTVCISGINGFPMNLMALWKNVSQIGLEYTTPDLYAVPTRLDVEHPIRPNHLILEPHFNDFYSFNSAKLKSILNTSLSNGSRLFDLSRLKILSIINHCDTISILHEVIECNSKQLEEICLNCTLTLCIGTELTFQCSRILLVYLRSLL